MTVQELFEITIGNMGLTTDNATTYSATLVPQVRTILARLYELENTIREAKGIAVLTAYPVPTTTTDVLTYQEEVLVRCASFGLAQLFALSDDDTIRAGYFGAVFAEEYKNLNRVIASAVEDVYTTLEDE